MSEEISELYLGSKMGCLSGDYTGLALIAISISITCMEANGVIYWKVFAGDSC